MPGYWTTQKAKVKTMSHGKQQTRIINPEAFSAWRESQNSGGSYTPSNSQIKFDLAEAPVNTERMSTPTREELDAKLQLIETRLDNKVQQIADKIDNFAVTSKDTQDAVKSLKTTVVATGISSVLAIVLGVAAFNATVLSNMVASFESGKSTATNLSQTQAQLEKREQRLNEIEKKLDTLISSKPAK